jgi:hypothetical protein
MKDKTDAMNRGFGGAPEKGYEKEPTGDLAGWRDRKKRQLKWANLDDNEAMNFVENMEKADEDYDIGGFLPRNNYEDRF